MSAKNRLYREQDYNFNEDMNKPAKDNTVVQPSMLQETPNMAREKIVLIDEELTDEVRQNTKDVHSPNIETLKQIKTDRRVTRSKTIAVPAVKTVEDQAKPLKRVTKALRKTQLEEP